MLNLSQDFTFPTTAGQFSTGSHLPGCSLSLVISEWVHRNHPILIMTPDHLTAQRLEDELRFFLSDPNILISHFPDWETLPYDHFSPHHAIISKRIAALYQISQVRQGIIIAAVSSLLQRLSPPDFIQKNSLVFSQHQAIDWQALRERSIQQGYYAVQQVITPGEFSIRGGLFDIFPMGAQKPLRIEIFDNQVESIRTFDPETQRTLERIQHFSLLPAREFPVNAESITLFRQQWRDHFSGNPTDVSIYRDISQQIIPSGIEYYLPLFFHETYNFLQHLPSHTVLIQWEDCHHACEQFWIEIHERYRVCNIDHTRPLLPPGQLYYPTSDFFALCKQFPQIKLSAKAVPSTVHFPTEQGKLVFLNHKLDKPLSSLQSYLDEHADSRVLFCAESAGRREKLLELLNRYAISPQTVASWQTFLAEENLRFAITVGPLTEGIECPRSQIMIITESQLFDSYVPQERHRKTKTQNLDNLVRNLAELQIGTPVVHIDHGIGRYRGLYTIQDGEMTTEYLTLEYANNDILYVPISALQLISRYGGLTNDTITLDKLGDVRWQKAKEKAVKQIKDVAANLLVMYAQREQKAGICYPLPEPHYTQFVSGFRFEETPDQEQAIQAVLNDMCSDKRMDRLICGDVGFGKTEVAMRAAFIAVCHQKQVAILVPTTLLAEQHFTTFQDRFADWPITIECLSRFRSQVEQKTILDKLQAGQLDIIIGTHKLIQPDIHYHDLGLVIIDEEHRFGVQQKERFKRFRAEVDILTLTATPIPRTLNMAMSQMRDLSIIATPPARRLAIKTFIQVRNSYVIREAIVREIFRGGQVFFLHNNVDSIERVARELIALVPEATVQIAHGQLKERALEKVMSDFYHQRFNVLVCTTIIETGIDIPTANTIVIDKADHFGLAQLHQLRGRVGRSHHQAYAYLLTRDPKAMSKDAKKRLDAFADLEDLGAGFILATHDLEIRGAGELLGDEQSGHIQTIGLSLYTELLAKTIHSLQSGESLTADTFACEHTRIDIKIAAWIPSDIIADVHERLMVYKRIANAETEAELDDLKEEIIDRFGLIPMPVQHLFAITKLKLKANALGISKFEANMQGGRIEFKPNAPIDPMVIVDLVQKKSDSFKLRSAHSLQIKWQATPDDIIQHVREIIELLSIN